jgi:hypothetical protein
MITICYRVRPANGAMAETEPAVAQILKVTTGAAAECHWPGRSPGISFLLAERFA